MVNVTTIQMPVELKHKLDKLKEHSRETYAEVIEDLIELAAEDELELSEETKREIEIAKRQMRAGQFYTLEQLKKKAGL